MILFSLKGGKSEIVKLNFTDYWNSLHIIEKVVYFEIAHVIPYMIRNTEFHFIWREKNHISIFNHLPDFICVAANSPQHFRLVALVYGQIRTFPDGSSGLEKIERVRMSRVLVIYLNANVRLDMQSTIPWWIATQRIQQFPLRPSSPNLRCWPGRGRGKVWWATVLFSSQRAVLPLLSSKWSRPISHRLHPS